jgi:hypothetical protein
MRAIEAKMYALIENTREEILATKRNICMLEEQTKALRTTTGVTTDQDSVNYNSLQATHLARSMLGTGMDTEMIINNQYFVNNIAITPSSIRLEEDIQLIQKEKRMIEAAIKVTQTAIEENTIKSAIDEVLTSQTSPSTSLREGQPYYDVCGNVTPSPICNNAQGYLLTIPDFLPPHLH